MIKILGISGSIRKQSFNTSVLKHVQSVATTKNNGAVEFKIADISTLPLYNQDIEDFGEAPESVQQVRKLIKEADAIVFVTPEHNYSIPTAMKNALDWASRPFGQNAFENKPGGILSASIGGMGGIKAQVHLRHILTNALNVHLINRPEVIVPFASTNIDENGSIKDENVKKNINIFLDELISWTEKLKNGSK
jgi:chromate reductase